MGIGRKQIFFIVAAIALTVVLYLLPQLNTDDGKAKPAGPYSFESILAQAKSQLDPDELESIGKLQSALDSDKENVQLLDSLGKMWDLALFPVVSAHYFEQIAILKPEERNWLNAAYRYFDAFKGTTDTTLRSLMVDKAIASYQKVISMNPDNLNARTDLGVCYAEGTAEPMKGIMMLREVVEVDSTHSNAHFNLGILSVRSGQLDKALERFTMVVELDPERIEARYLLGRTLIQLGESEKGVNHLREISKYTTDPEVLVEVNKLINQANNQ